MPRALSLLAFLIVTTLGGAAAFVSAHQIDSDEGPLASMTDAPSIGGVPAESNCTLCHQDYGNPCEPVPCNYNAPGGGIVVTGLPATYEPDHVYALRVHLWSDSTLAAPEPLWGFEMTAVRTLDGQGAGRWEPSSADSFSVLTGFGPFASRSYVEQTFFGAHLGEHGSVDWTVYWRSPIEDVGEIRLYFAGVAGNGNDEPGPGDWVYTSSVSTSSGVVPARAVSWGHLKSRYH